MPDHPPASGPPLTEWIRQRMPELPPAERRVARALLSGSATAGLASSARLAELTGVSGPTVSRFAGHLGFANYGAFQDALRADLAARVKSPVDLYRESLGQTGADPLGSAGSALSRAVARSIDELPMADFERATGLLAGSRRHVVATGGWYSHLLADYFCTRLQGFRPHVRVVPPVAGERAAVISDLEKRDTVAVFDFRRYERDTEEFARAARSAGANVILFTDPWLSPIVDVADAILPAQVTGPAPFETLAPTIAVVETLLTAVARALGEAGNRRFERFGGVVDRWLHAWPDSPSEPGTGD